MLEIPRNLGSGSFLAVMDGRAAHDIEQTEAILSSHFQRFLRTIHIARQRKMT